MIAVKKEEAMPKTVSPLSDGTPNHRSRTQRPEHLFDDYLSRGIQSWIEQRYYQKIDDHGQLENLLHDPTFLLSPQTNSSLYADHGVVHARDVATQILQVLERVNGVLIPSRDTPRLKFMKGYGVQVAYLHDIGLCDPSKFGRTMHAYAVAQRVLSAEFDELLDMIWSENAGDVPGSLVDLPGLDQDPRLILREMLALAICHSKSAIPVALLNSPGNLRRTVQRCAISDLRSIYDREAETGGKPAAFFAGDGAAQLLETDPLESSGSPERIRELHRWYGDFSSEGFQWLISPAPTAVELTQDVLDTLRALRCADALRQRGTTLKTSGNYEIFVDQRSGNAIYALRHADHKLFLLESQDPISAGEANLASCELTLEGDLRISFHRGSFTESGAVDRAAGCAAQVLHDIQRDVIESFQPSNPVSGSQDGCEKTADEMRILLESVDDNPEFAVLVKREILKLHPPIQNPVRVVPSLKNASAHERALYLEGSDLDWDAEGKLAALDRIAWSGHNTQSIDPNHAFREVKHIQLQAGSTLIEAGAPPSFVYIPLTEGLEVIPLGGYPPLLIQAWMPLGITGVIRGSIRNATVVAEQDVNLLMIPHETYLKHWHRTLTMDEFLSRTHSEIVDPAADRGELA